jgi:hypothetical protein
MANDRVAGILFSWRTADNRFRNEAHQQALAAQLRGSGGAKCNPSPWSVKARPAKSPAAIHAMHEQIRTYAELQQHMRYALREQHPEWIEPDSDSPICHSYERRFAELLALFAKSGTRSAETLND